MAKTAQNAGALFAFDRRLRSRFVAGADEAGRGALAGPIVGAAVLLDQERIGAAERRTLSGIGDSKRLSAAKRESLYPLICAHATLIVISVRSHGSIDRRGIEPCNREALADPLRRIERAYPEAALLADGLGRGLADARLNPITALVRGDGRSAAIACASIIAKVSRDRIMQRAGAVDPRYGFELHCGYGTAAHREAILIHGRSSRHRASFTVKVPGGKAAGARGQTDEQAGE